MKSLRWARAIAFGTVALFGVATVVLTRPLPKDEAKASAVALQLRERHDTLGKNETLVTVLTRAGLNSSAAGEALTAASKTLNMRRIPLQMAVRVRGSIADSLPSEITFGVAIDSVVHVRRSASGWTSVGEKLPWKADTIVLRGVVTSNLYEAVDSAAIDLLGVGSRVQLTNQLAGLYEYRVDMYRDLRVGDSFTVVAERLVGPTGAVRIGGIVAATMKLSGVTMDAVRFKSSKVRSEYFDAEGKSLRTGFLQAPLELFRISSRFGMRRHPILGTMRRHEGQDYAAKAGTPIRAIGDGVVIKAGWGNGYGNMIEIRHANGFVSRYGHMRGFASGIGVGKRVAIASTIGYVGSTGLSTAPHLHFEVLVRGVNRDPRQALRNATTESVPTTERGEFAAARAHTFALLRLPNTMVATADSPGTKTASQ